LGGWEIRGIKKKRKRNALALGGHCFIFRHSNKPIVGGSNGRDDGEDARQGWSVWEGVVSFGGAAN
jgi:hypothetical protein